MLYQITDATVTVGNETIFSHIDFEIHGTEKIAIVGRNGAGKTTFLRLMAGELEADRDDRRQGLPVRTSRSVTIGYLKQEVFADTGMTVEEWLHEQCSHFEAYSREQYEYEREFDRILTGFGFSKEDKKKSLSEFSGGEQTKIAFIRLLLEKPDILLLDEPTNHLDEDAVDWLERYMQSYPKAVVMVSHDRFFLDRTAEVVYELSQGRLKRYSGNYTAYRNQKQKNYALNLKAYERQQEEVRRQKALIERFKHKPKKAAFARSRKKMMERMELLEKPVADESHIFTGELVPENIGSKRVLDCENLVIGYDKPLLTLNWRLRRGQKIGLIGSNGAGKTTFLKTAAGLLQALKGKMITGNGVSIGYFDQHTAQISSEKTVIEHFLEHFPAKTDKEARSVLASYMFYGAMAYRKVCDLSGGEKARLVLCELLTECPNFLILDEPTNHMDIPAKETMESAFSVYKGTILFVSHDRYFVDRVAQELLIFEDGQAAFYPFGYSHYIERKSQNPELMRAKLGAKEAAMIADLKAVPKPERHRLAPIGTEESYFDWRLRLAAEKMDEAKNAAESIAVKLAKSENDQLEKLLAASVYFYRKSNKVLMENAEDDVADCIADDITEDENDICEDLRQQLNAATDCWTAACCEWYEIYEEWRGCYDEDRNT